MTNRVTVYRKIFDEAHGYLLSFDLIDENMLDKHINSWKECKIQSVQDLLWGMLESVSNKQAMPHTIGPIEKLRPFLEDFSPPQIIEK